MRTLRRVVIAEKFFKNREKSFAEQNRYVLQLLHNVNSATNAANVLASRAAICYGGGAWRAGIGYDIDLGLC